MDPNKRKMAEGWLDQVGTHLSTAKERVKSHYTIPEAVQAAQTCVELSVKAVLAFLDIDFPKVHGWGEKQMQALAASIRKRGLVEKLAETPLNYTVNLPRLIMLMNFWGEFYLLAKYGMEAGSLATPKDLVKREEAELAIQHAEECERAASALRYLNDEQRKHLLS
jgi:HEPN domain-containing protein